MMGPHSVINLGFAALISLTLILAFIAFSYLDLLHHEVYTLSRTHLSRIDDLHRMRETVRDRLLLLYHISTHSDPLEREILHEQYLSLSPIFIDAHTRILSTNLDDEQHAALEKIKPLIDQSYATNRRILDLALNGQMIAARQLLNKEGAHRQNAVKYHIDKLIITQKLIMHARETKAQAAYGRGRMLVTVLALCDALLGMLIAVTVVRRVRAHRERLIDAQHTGELLRHKAHHDALCHIPNRAGFEAIAATLLKQCGSNQSVTLFLIDLDGFKQVNDSAGHAAGDLVLAAVARRLHQELRASGDIIARYGGDEFVALSASLGDDNEVIGVAKRLLSALAPTHLIDHQSFTVSASIGIARFPRDGNDLCALMRAADSAMYTAKRSGKNTYVFHKSPS